MKNIFRFLMAVAVLFTASCAKEDISSSIGGGEANVTFTVDLPELGTRAYADGTKATTLRYYVFDGDNYLPGISSESLPEKKVTLTNGKAVVTLPLLKGMIYNIIFWADKDGCYSINTDNKTVTVDYTGAYANDDNRDAFYKYLSNVDPTDDDKIKEQTNVTLTRPFGQLNAATSDFDAVVKNEVDLSTSALTVIANKTLDLTTGMGSNQGEFSFEPTAIPTETLKDGYKYLSMNYLIPGNVDVVYSFNATKGGQDFTFTDTSYTNVPIKANYRTNILGALLTKPTAFNVEILPGFGGEEEYDVEDIHVATAQELVAAVDTVAATGGEIVLVEDIELSDILVITSTPASRTANAEDKVITLDGNGKKLISTAGRAINVSGAENVIIKNLIIECSGERAINVIGNTKNVTIENVTATAANYTVNVAGSAPNAVVAINNSTLNGLCTVNVAGAGAEVTLDNCTVNCNDNNTTAGEAYAALSLNKDAVGGSIIATNTTVNVTEGSDSMKGRNGAEDGTVTIDGSTEGVAVMVAAITYPGSDYYHAFATLQAAIEFAKAGDTIQLIRDITLTEALVIPADKNFTLNLNGKTVTAVEYAFENSGNLTIEGDGVVNGIVYNANGGEIAINGGTYNAVDGGKWVLLNEGGKLTINAATINGGSSYPIYSYNANANLVINNAIVNATFGCINSYGLGSTVEINGGTYKMTGVQGKTSHIAYFSNVDAVINGGTFEKIGDINMSGAGGGGICVIYGANLTINNGDFAGDYADLYDWGGTNANGRANSISITGGTFKFKPTANFVADGYKAVENDNKWYVFSNNVNVVTTTEEFKNALTSGGEIILFENVALNKIDLTTQTQDVVIDANGNTITTSSNYGVQVTAGKNITLKNAKVAITVEGNYITYAAGFKVENGDYQGKTILLENCDIQMINGDWAYAVNMPASVKNLNLVIDGCTLEGAIALQCWGDNNTITITNSNLICNYTTSSLYTSYCVALQGDGANNSENNTLNISGCAFSYSGVDNYNSTIKAVSNHKYNGANTITVVDCTYDNKVTPFN